MITINDVVFSISTRCETKSHCQLPIACVLSIKNIYPDSKIVIVDSNSPEKSHIPELINLGCEISDLENINYETGAMWDTFEKVKKQRYVFLQDSMLLLGNIDPFLQKEFTSLGDIHYNWYGAGDRHIDWVRNNIKLSDYLFMETGFSILQYNSMIISDSLLEKMKLKKLNKVLPVNKVGSCGMERLLGMVLSQEGFPISDSNQLPQTLIKKICMDRQ